MFQSTEVLLCQSNDLCQHSSLVQLIQLTSYSCTVWRPDLRFGGVEVHIIYIPFHTQPTTYRATLTEKKLPALTWMYCKPSPPTVWSSHSDRVVPTKLCPWAWAGSPSHIIWPGGTHFPQEPSNISTSVAMPFPSSQRWAHNHPIVCFPHPFPLP